LKCFLYLFLFLDFGGLEEFPIIFYFLLGFARVFELVIIGLIFILDFDLSFLGIFVSLAFFAFNSVVLIVKL